MGLLPLGQELQGVAGAAAGLALCNPATPIHRWAAGLLTAPLPLFTPRHPVSRCSTPGKYATKVGMSAYHTCEPCAEGYYRSGDSSPYNNVCLKIPDGAPRGLLSWRQCAVLGATRRRWV